VTPSECTCVPPEIIPPLGGELNNHNVTLTTTLLSANQQNLITTLPDTAFNAFENQASCCCENAKSAAFQNATKIRHFDIKGDICVTENVWFAESGHAAEESLGSANRNILYSENLQESGL